MPRPITKADVKRWRKANNGWNMRCYSHEVLGLYIKLTYGRHVLWCYTTDASGSPIWVSKKTIQRRKKLGHPRKKPKQLLREVDFGLDDMALAEQIMAGISQTG